MKNMVITGDSFSGNISITDVGIVSISGVWVDGSGTSTANGNGLILEGMKGEYTCPVHGVVETVTALATSSTTTDGGVSVHRVGDSVTCDAGGHTNISVVTTSGQSNCNSN